MRVVVDKIVQRKPRGAGGNITCLAFTVLAYNFLIGVNRRTITIGNQKKALNKNHLIGHQPLFFVSTAPIVPGIPQTISITTNS